MYLLNLPDEMLLCIANSLDQARDLLALACLNRAANNLFLDYLYRFKTQLCLVLGSSPRQIGICGNDVAQLSSGRQHHRR
jgi:hypothetical protein